MTSQPRTVSVIPVSVHDQATDKDELGFEPYVRALARFLINQHTKPPLAVSIEGEWGSGKSSFMKQLQKEVVRLEKEQHKRLSRGLWRRRSMSGYQRREPLSVWFNAWRNDQDESVWAAFAQTFIKQVSEQRFFLRRWWGHLRLLLLRFGWKTGGSDAAKSLFWTICILGSLGALGVLSNTWGPELIDETLDTNNNQTVLNAVRVLGSGTSISALIALLFWARKTIKNPLNINLARYVSTVNYNQYIAFVDRFHEDQVRVVDAYAKGRTVYVFIDDLDRCDVPKAADLMKAFNLMISDEPNLVFIIGMDRAKVAAGIAVKYEELLPYIYSEREGYFSVDGGRLRVNAGLEFGYDFIEKFIQLPFSVPRSSSDEFDDYLRAISSVRPSESEKQSSRWAGWLKRFGGESPLNASRSPTLPRNGDQSETGTPVSEGQEGGANTDGVQTVDAPAAVDAPTEDSQEVSHDAYSLRIAEDQDMIVAITKELAPALDYNPRRIKQFMNLFRLRILIAGETGLFRESEDRPAITPGQIGMFVAISFKWPLLVNDLIKNPSLLSQLQQEAINP